MLKRLFQFFSRNNFKIIFLIVIGTITWSLTMVRSGLCWNEGCLGGVGFWGANGHDAIWHISLINSLSKGDLSLPIFAGMNIQNYHIGYDLFLSWIVKLTNISPSVLYFQIIPPILALLIGILTYKFVLLWRGSKEESMLATFFVYFGGSFGWLVSLVRGQGWGGESMFWSQQSISTLINPPFALSMVIILLGLIFFHKYLQGKNKLFLILTALLLGVSIFVKVYAGLLVIASLVAVSIWSVIKKKNLWVIPLTIISALIALVLFISFNKTSVGLIAWSPFWFLESMATLSDRLNWQRLFSAMTTYKMGHIWIKAILAYSFAFAIFIIGNFGTRLITLRALLKSPKKLLSAGPIEIFIFTIIMAGIVVPMFFVQKGTAWNTIQFLYYSLMFAGIVAGIEVWGLIKNKSNLIKTISLILLLVVTLPTTIASLGNYLPPKPQSILPKSEVEALDFLSKEERGVVLTYPFDIYKSEKALAPRPLYLYTSTAYVSGFSGQPVFVEDQINLDIMQYHWQDRVGEVNKFLNTLDVESATKFIKENNIKYVYWLRDQHARIGDKQLGLIKIYENSDVTIYVVN